MGSIVHCCLYMLFVFDEYSDSFVAEYAISNTDNMLYAQHAGMDDSI